MLQLIKKYFGNIGEIKIHADTNEKIYFTERDARKNQIYIYKTKFVTTDGNIFVGKNCIAISLDICKKLISEEVKHIYFNIKNFPLDKDFHTIKVTLTDFLINSVTIKETGYDEQRIIPYEKINE